MGAVSVPGAAGVVAARRRRINAAVIGAVAFVVVAVPVGTYMLTGHHSNSTPAAAGAPPTASSSPSGSPSAAPSSPAPTVAPVTWQDLANATVNLPVWADGQCPSGTVTLHNGQVGKVPSTHGIAKVVKTASVDLDHDGSADLVAVLECPIGNPSIFEAVGFHRTADGSIRALGSVVPDMTEVADLRAGGGGSIQLLVSSLAGSDGSAEAGQVLQWRTYEWAGTRFNQTAGSTSFKIDVPGLTATVSDATFAAAVKGTRTGTMTVTLHNGGTTTVSDVSIVYELTVGKLAAPACEPLASVNVPMSGACRIAPIAPGATATVTFMMTSDYVDSLAGMSFNQIGENMIQVRVGDQYLAAQPKLGRVIVT